MEWCAVYTNMPEEHLDLSDRAFRLHEIAWRYCARNLLDGVLSDRELRVVKAIANNNTNHVRELCRRGLWEAEGSGYRLVGYLDINPTKDRVKAERAKARERMRRLRSGERSAERTGERSGTTG